MACHPGTDPTRICRICMQDITDLVAENMFELLKPGRPSLNGMLSTICPAVFSSGEHQQNGTTMPERICPSCVLKIEAAYELYQTCIENDRNLCEMFFVKQEEMEIEEVEIKMPLECHEEYISVKTEESTLEDGLKIEEIGKTSAEEGSVPKVRRKYNRTKPKKYEPKLVEPNLEEMKSTIGTRKDASSGSGLACVLCTIKFRHINPLKIHLRTDHAGQVFPCDTCQNVYLKEEELVDHKLFHETGRLYGCSTCGKRYTHASHLREHRNIHKADSSHLCTICGKGFHTASNLYQHMLRHSEKKYACDQCPSKFFSNGGLKTHQQAHTKEKNFCCDVCSTRFTMKHALVKHMKKHMDNPPTYPCDVCHRTFSSAGHAKRHKLIHTGEKPYKCTECDRSFTQSNDLVKHSKTHFGDKPYQCDRCDESFRLIANLRDHYKVHANSDPIYNDGEESSKSSSGNKKLKKDPWFTSSKVLGRRFQRKQVNNGENSEEQGSDEEPEIVQSKMVDISQIPVVTGDIN